MKIIWQLIFIFRRPFIYILRLYQKTISPDHSRFGRTIWPQGVCRYYPTCSQYSIEAIEKYGIIRGIPKSIWRVLRCNPWSEGGVDRP